VDIKVTATGINGDKKTAKQFWAVWDPGEKKTIEGSFWSDTSVLHFPRKSLIKPPCSPAVRTASGDSPLSGQRGQRG
jgi:hypothetical protein